LDKEEMKMPSIRASLLVLSLLALLAVPSGARPAVTFISNGIAASANFIDFSNPSDVVLVNLTLFSVGEAASPAPKYVLSYFIFDVNNTFNDVGFGFIPTASVNLSGGSITSGKTVLKLNVNTCDVAGFTTSGGPCGAFDFTWTEAPLAGFVTTSFRGTTVTIVGGVSKTVTNGTFQSMSALGTGSALGFMSQFPVETALSQNSGVAITLSAP